MAKFRVELAALLEVRQVNPAAYSRLLGHLSNGLVYNVLGGHRDVPLEELDTWLSVLGVKPGTPEYRHMRRIAYEDYAPPHVLRLINQMTYEVAIWAKLTDQALRERGIQPPPLPDFWPDVPPSKPVPKRAKRKPRPAKRKRPRRVRR